MSELNGQAETLEAAGVDMAESVDALQARAQIHTMAASVTEEVKATFLDGQAMTLAPPPAGAFNRLFEAIGNFIEELLSGCRAETLFSESQRMKSGLFHRNRRRKWQRAIVQKTRGEITTEAADAILQVGIDKQREEYERLQSLQFRAQVIPE